MNNTVYRELGANKRGSYTEHAIEQSYHKGFEEGYHACEAKLADKSAELANLFEVGLHQSKMQMQGQWNGKLAQLRDILNQFCGKFSALHQSLSAQSYMTENSDSNTKMTVIVPFECARYFPAESNLNLEFHDHPTIILSGLDESIVWQIDQFQQDLLGVFSPLLKDEIYE